MVGKILLILLDKHFLKLFAIMQTTNMVENKQCQLGLIILLAKLVQFIFSFHIFFPAWKQLGFSHAQLVSPLLSSSLWLIPSCSKYFRHGPRNFFVFWNTTIECRLVFCSYPSLCNNAWVVYLLRLASRHMQ